MPIEFRYGSDSEVVANPSHVRFTPRSGGKADMPIPTLWASSGHPHTVWVVMRSTATSPAANAPSRLPANTVQRVPALCHMATHTRRGIAAIS